MFDGHLEKQYRLTSMTASAWSGSNLNIRLIIRGAEVGDARLLAELGARTFSETFADDNSAADMADYLSSAFSEAQQATELADAHCTFQIAEMNGVAVRYALLRAGSAPASVTNNKPIELVRLYVCREHFGRGVGARLMEVCISKASQLGYRTLWLGVWEHNHRAQAFYRKWKFHEAGTHIFRLGNDTQTDLLMERSITTVDTE
jgi:GNAT superfamily N-acetyltransferase